MLNSFVFCINTRFASTQGRHLVGEALEILAELCVRIRVGRGCEPDTLLDCELDDAVARIKFVDRFAPGDAGFFIEGVVFRPFCEGILR